MSGKPYSLQALRTAASFAALILTLAVACPALGDEDSDNANAEAAGQRAHFVREFCGQTADDVAQYKEQLRGVLTQASQFDLRWQAGWRRGDNDAIQMRSLRLSSPEDFKVRVKNNCSRIKWQAANSLRPRPDK
ncbi:hypothetical protein PQQ51_02110 [Paraburkholderia xenovorans]|uniref:hypothetical protein n=1 Tax=Paraburkholderia xenovorans TaxID=36873 RepID=UPI0038B9A2D7